MTEQTTSLPPLWRQLTWWSLAFPIVMIVALAQHNQSHQRAAALRA
jgi:hypothetical protein